MTISSGQVLSVPMILVGAAVLVWAYYFQAPVVAATAETQKLPTRKAK
jgi:prolipoprotein diacylglyceryltransferase